MVSHVLILLREIIESRLPDTNPHSWRNNSLGAPSCKKGGTLKTNKRLEKRVTHDQSAVYVYCINNGLQRRATDIIPVAVRRCNTDWLLSSKAQSARRGTYISIGPCSSKICLVSVVL